MMYGIRFLLAPLTIPPGPFLSSLSPFLFLFARTGVRRDEFRAKLVVDGGLSDVLAIFIDFFPAEG